MWRRQRLEELFISCRSSSLYFPLLSQMSHSPSLGVSIQRVGRVTPFPLHAFHVLNPHSCSRCVTSSHSVLFSTSSPSQLTLLLPPFFFFFFLRPSTKSNEQKCRRIKSKCVSHILPDTWEPSRDDLLEPIKRQRVVSLDVHYHWCAILPSGCVILAVWWDNWADQLIFVMLKVRRDKSKWAK